MTHAPLNLALAGTFLPSQNGVNGNGENGVDENDPLQVILRNFQMLAAIGDREMQALRPLFVGTDAEYTGEPTEGEEPEESGDRLRPRLAQRHLDPAVRVDLALAGGLDGQEDHVLESKVSQTVHTLNRLLGPVTSIIQRS